MYQVSQEYKNSVKQPIRNRSHIKVVLGLINLQVQESAVVEDKSNYIEYSDFEKIFNQSEMQKDYATYEQKCFRADGSMLFKPRSEKNYLKNILVSQYLISSGFIAEFSFGCGASDIKGISIQFGDSYPIKFKIRDSNNLEYEFENTGSYFETDTIFENTGVLKIIVEEMLEPNSRFRIHYIKFGLGLEYDDEMIITADSATSLSMINEDLPESECTIVLNNEKQIFNVDNPSSDINFLESGQKINVRYGYELDDGSTEWMQLHTMYVYEWSSDDLKATIKAVDRFKFMDGNYYKGQYYSDGISLYNLAEIVFADAGISSEDYFIDSYLKNIIVHNPIPNVTHKEALQIIANAGRCVMDYDRYGRIRIYHVFYPEVLIESNGTESYSNIRNVQKDMEKIKFATYEQHFWTTDGSMLFLPRNNWGK